MTIYEYTWQPPPINLVLSSDEVHVWCISLDQPTLQVQQLAQTLCTDELARAGRFYREQHSSHFIVGRGFLRTLLGRYLGIEARQVEFCYEPRGKPALAKTCGSGTLRFNLSHSQGLALYAIACHRTVGVDLEYLRPLADAEQIAKRFFSVREYKVISALPPSQKQAAFFNCWTRKEAYLKATGDGLAHPLDQVEVTLAPGEPAQLLSIAGSPKAASCWSLQELTPETGYVAALAVEGNSWRLKCFKTLHLPAA